MSNSICPPELRRLYREGRVIPFVGAGASMAVHWTGANGKETWGPSWRELVDEAARLIGVDDPELLRVRGTDLQIVEYLKSKDDTLQPLINWLVKRMNPNNADLLASPTLTALASLKECALYYTTNYDDFLERALELSGRSTLAVRSEHDMSASGTGTQVVKFHGDINRPDTMVLSESDYERRMRLEGPLDLKLRADVLGRALLFVGYSFRDANVAYLFRLITDHFGDLPKSFAGKRAYIIYPNPSDFELQLFHARHIEVIPVSATEIATRIAAVLEEMGR
jgi:hypothetical protein